MSTVKCIGILTSGGDAPGMNAAIRAVTRSAIYNGMSVKGIYRGYKGLITDEIEDFKTQNVSNIIQRGGTILKTARCAEFKTPEGRKQAYDKLMEHGIDALVAIGGDGTLTGARIFAQEFNYPIVGLPGTIDNDLYGTDITIGYDTALNTIMECVDKIRDTATSHDRLFFIEVMGRDAGFLALNGAIASGAEAAIIPEISMEKDQLAEMIETGFRKSKNSRVSTRWLWPTMTFPISLRSVSTKTDSRSMRSLSSLMLMTSLIVFVVLFCLFFQFCFSNVFSSKLLQI